MGSKADIPRRGSRRWRHSLYARAALFLALGSGTLIGAVAVLSSSMVEESVDRLLDERTDLARTAGVFIEHQIRSDMERLVDHVEEATEGSEGLPVEPLRTALDGEYRAGLFSEGAFVLDSAGQFVTGVPDGAHDVRQVVDFDQLTRQAREQGGLTSTPLIELGNRHVLLVIEVLRSATGAIVGYVGALLQPAATNLLNPLEVAGDRGQTELDLVDDQGFVVASTDPRLVFQQGDHGSLLATAILDGDQIRGRCHSCHMQSEEPVERETDVMAFAPLPTLPLGVAVRQPEQEALSPAFALQRRLNFLGLAFVSLFVLFAGLSVRSVVLPITRLTEAVHRSESSHQRVGVGKFGRDEVGELASALELWRGRMLDSLAAAERHRQALTREIDETRRHLDVLQDIVAQSTVGSDLHTIVDHALERSLDLLGLSLGVMGFRQRAHDFLVWRGLSRDDAEYLLRRGREVLADRKEQRPVPASGPYWIDLADLSDEAENLRSPSLRTIVVAGIEGPQGAAICAVLCDEEARPVEERRISSLLRHLSLAAANRLLRESDLERQKLQRLYLHRVLKAQEGERRRVARELHDTLAQDLAALRLEIERLTNRAQVAQVRERLTDLEERTSEMLIAVRRILLDLRLSVLESMGFLPALQWQLERMEQTRGIRATFVVDGDEVELPYEMAVTLFRILQESLVNVVQHAEADHVFVTVGYRPDLVELTVEDDGRGFDPNAVREQRSESDDRGLGLLGMEERASLLGGTMTIQSSPGEGTTVKVSVPLPERG